MASSATRVTGNDVPNLPLQAIPVPTFLETASKTVKLAAAIGFALVALGSMAIGITLTPFQPEIGVAAIAFSTAMFGTAGYLFYNAISTTGSRDIAVIN